jgi:hypothetical protein
LKNIKNGKRDPVKWPPSASVGIGGCVSPQPRFYSDISELARLWRAFSCVAGISQTATTRYREKLIIISVLDRICAIASQALQFSTWHMIGTWSDWHMERYLLHWL